MTEKLGYGDWHYDDDDTGHDDDYQGDHEQYLYEADPDFIHEDFPDQRDQLEHQLDFAEDDSGQIDFDAQYGAWRSKAYRRGKGKFKPPKRRHHRTPVFVKVRDLQSRAGG